MYLHQIRLGDDSESTIGALYINGDLQSFSLEDEYRDEKIMGETRIPEGVYDIELRAEGGFHNRYLKRYGSDFHKGMLHIKDVPNFKWILIHAGNTEKHTAGCLLTGFSATFNPTSPETIGSSRDSYKHIYPQIRDAILRGERVQIEYVDLDRKLKTLPS